MAKYKWKDGSRVTGISAEVAGRELERIRKYKGGELVAREVVHQSKPKEAPLHNHFEWNNAKAGQLYREDQARYVIRALRVVYDEPGDKKNVETRAFVQIEKEDKSRSYTTMVNALSDDEMRHQVIYKAHKALITAKRELKEIGELVEAIDLIDQALEKVDFVLKREENKLSLSGAKS